MKLKIIVSATIILLLLIIMALLHHQRQQSLDVKIGQMIMIGFDGMRVNKDSPIVKDIQKYHIGGVLLFERDPLNNNVSRNVENPEQLKQLTQELQHFATTPLFIAIDQEGGSVTRLTEERGFPATKSAQQLGHLDDSSVTQSLAQSMASTLVTAGINVDFAPDVDLNSNPDNPIIGKRGRSFSENPEVVIKHARIFINAFHQDHIICTLKHFPGHGSSTQDTHEGFVDVTDSWTKKELEPYKILLKTDPCGMVMIAHVFNANIDPKYPASLSYDTVTKLLRDKLKFKGVIVTDDLEMGAIAKNYSLKQAIALAINAGDDVLVFSNNKANPGKSQMAKKVFTTIKELVKQGKVPEVKINAAYERIMALKEKQLITPNKAH